MGSIKSFFTRHRHRKTASHISNSSSSSSSSSSSTFSPTPTSPNSDLRRVFAKFDCNGDGKISSSELSAIFESLGHRPTPSDLQSMMSEADSDGDGFISLEEFIDLNTRGVDEDGKLEDLKHAFSVFDLDRNGSITANELASVLRCLGEGATVAECRRMIGAVDVDGDGMISFDEFKAMMAEGGNLLSTKF